MKNDGIVCKVWNVQGTTSTKKAGAQIKDSISYILNEEKTDIQLEMQGSVINDEKGQLDRECRYIGNDIKTVNGAYIGTRNLVSDNIEEAVEEMMETKKFYRKLDGRAALHGMISLSEFDTTNANAADLLKLCEAVMEELFPNHQAIFAVHANTDNLHVHFIVNSVGLDGRKIHQPDGYIRNVVQPCVNKYALQFGFTPNEKWRKYHSGSMPRYSQIKMDLRKAIDLAIEKSFSMDDFITELNLADVSVNVGKHISLQLDGMDKAMRTHQLGSNYTKEAILERIQNRCLAFEKKDVGTYAMNRKVDDVVVLRLSVLKKYSELSKDEQQRVVKMLKIGQNPWKVRARSNWQLKNMENELNTAVRLHEYINFYSSDGSVKGALDGIIEAKKKIASDKKEIRELQKRYKPIIDIYNQMRLIEKKAYLYEHEGVDEFRKEFDEYRELTRRLRYGYNKDIEEVSTFVNGCQDRILYANAQLEELSAEYREIKKYCLLKGIVKIQPERLVDNVRIKETKKLTDIHVYTREVYYLVSPENPNLFLRVQKTPETDLKGHIYEAISLEILNSYGEVLESYNSKNGMSEFKASLNRIEKNYKLRNCETFKDISKAQEFAESCKDAEMASQNPGIIPAKSKEKKTDVNKTDYSFTQAINLYSAAGKTGKYVIANMNNASYMAIISTDADKSVEIQVVDKNGRRVDRVSVPGVKESSNEGYKIITKIKDEYGFDDQMYAFGNIEEAKSYINMTEKRSINK